MNKLVTIKNNFHNTSAKVRTEVLWHGLHHEVTLTKAQHKTLKRKLCCADCTCGYVRGPQEFNGQKLIVNISNRVA